MQRKAALLAAAVLFVLFLATAIRVGQGLLTLSLVVALLAFYSFKLFRKKRLLKRSKLLLQLTDQISSPLAEIPSREPLLVLDASITQVQPKAHTGFISFTGPDAAKATRFLGGLLQPGFYDVDLSEAPSIMKSFAKSLKDHNIKATPLLLKAPSLKERASQAGSLSWYSLDSFALSPAHYLLQEVTSVSGEKEHLLIQKPDTTPTAHDVLGAIDTPSGNIFIGGYSAFPAPSLVSLRAFVNTEQAEHIASKLSGKLLAESVIEWDNLSPAKAAGLSELVKDYNPEYFTVIEPQTHSPAMPFENASFFVYKLPRPGRFVVSGLFQEQELVGIAIHFHVDPNHVYLD